MSSDNGATSAHEQIDGESEKAYDAFLRYATLPDGQRTIQQVEDSYEDAADAPASGSLRKWQSKYRWRERCGEVGIDQSKPPQPEQPEPIITADGISITPVKPGEMDTSRMYWCGLHDDCPVSTTTVGGVLYAKVQEWPDEDGEGGPWTVTVTGRKRPGAYNRLSDSALRKALAAMARMGVRVQRDEDGSVIKADVMPIMTPESATRPARYNYDLEPLAKWAFIKPVAVDKRGVPSDLPERSTALPAAMYAA
jgi:hypothetical protein